VKLAIATGHARQIYNDFHWSNWRNVLSLRGKFFQCHVFAMKSVQNLKYFWRSSQNYFVLALFSSL
jgi:hypothetical protein